jgi:hypothetical protein
MNLRHIAALALVGWYLLQPIAFDRDGTLRDVHRVPMSQWDRFSFDTKEDCEDAATRFHAEAERWKKSPPVPAADNMPAIIRWSNSVRIPSDNPRLKSE